MSTSMILEHNSQQKTQFQIAHSISPARITLFTDAGQGSNTSPGFCFLAPSMRRAESKWALCDPALILADTLPVNTSIRRTQRCVRQVSSQLQSFSPENILTPIASLMLTRCPSRFPQFQFLEVTYNQCRCTCCRALPRASITRSPVPAPSIPYRLCLQDHDRLRK